ncbi:MAG: NAD(P)-dependent oxidoreductase [Candidatus Alcyoniella australis]|nr:NAD(P)-dependent oxidoreductase [Candidatus Alcyoniella australis]
MMGLILPPGYEKLRFEERKILDDILRKVLALDDIQCLVWGGSSVFGGVERGSDVDLWAIVADPENAERNLLEDISYMDTPMHVHVHGYLRWFGRLITILFFHGCRFAVDVGLAKPEMLTELNIGPTYWIVWVSSDINKEIIVNSLQPRNFTSSPELRSSSLLMNLVKLRKSIRNCDRWNAHEYLSRARRDLMGIIRDKKTHIDHHYSRPERGLEKHLTATEHSELASTLADIDLKTVTQAAIRVGRLALAKVQEDLSDYLRGQLINVINELDGMPCDRKQSVGLIGAGRMGGRLVRHLLAAGYELYVADLDDRRSESAVRLGATRDNLEGIWEHCRIILLSLPAPEIIELVLEQIIKPECPRHILVDLSTNDPVRVVQASSKCRELGHGFIDAPVSGGIWGASAGTLTVMVGGSTEDYKVVRPLLDCFAREIFHVGPSGHGSMAKLIHNMVGEIQVQAFSEAFCLAKRLGLDSDAIYGCLANGMAASRILTDLYANGVLRQQWQTNVTLATAAKDQQLLLELATSVGVELDFSRTVYMRQAELIKEGMGNSDVTETIRWFEKKYGVHILVGSPPLPPLDNPT